VNFSTSEDGWDDMNFWDQKIVGGLRPTKGTPLEYTFSIVTTSSQKYFSCRLRIAEIPPFLALALPVLETSVICHDSRVCYPHIYGFAMEIVDIR